MLNVIFIKITLYAYMGMKVDTYTYWCRVDGQKMKKHRESENWTDTTKVNERNWNSCWNYHNMCNIRHENLKAFNR